MSKSRYYNWQNILFFSIVPLASLIGTLLLCIFSHIVWQTWVLTAVLVITGGLSITAGYHRLFSHKAYQASRPVQWFFILFGASAFEGSVLEWATDHRNHHRYVDTPRDPYNIKQGFWHAHMGWLFHLDYSKRDYSNVADLNSNKLLRMQHQYYVWFASGMGLVLPTLIAACWGQALAGFIIAGLLRLTFVHHGTFCINSLCHIVGGQQYATDTTARDNWLSALVTFGEGYHNYHHQFSRDYRNGVRFYHFDPSKWFIFGLSKLGLASKLYRVPKYRLIQARFEVSQRALSNKTQPQLLQQLQESIQQCITKIKKFEAAYAESKLREYQVNIAKATNELKQLFQQWQQHALAV